MADLIASRLDEFDESVIQTIATAAQMHPGRWRFVLRTHVASARHGDGLNAARLLEPIGEQSDVQRLRAFARRQRKVPGTATLGRQLSRQLAARVVVEDQNRVMGRGTGEALLMAMNGRLSAPA